MGSVETYITLGLMYEDGDGVEKDLQKAEEYFKKARELGYEG
ncbi:SEL1-like repeat protein [Helicobacter suis]|nr:SEL1-like repeat protein [Helicobacter suis]